MVGFRSRLEVGTGSEYRFKELLERTGWAVYSIGSQHFDFSESVRKIIENNTVKFIRHLPDFLIVCGADAKLVEVKGTTPNYYDGENFSIEDDSLETLRKIASLGIKVIVVFENRPNEFYWGFVDEIKETPIHYQFLSSYGSRTPASLIKKKSLIKWE